MESRCLKDALNYITNFYPPAAEKQREQAAFCDEITQFDYQMCIRDSHSSTGSTGCTS